MTTHNTGAVRLVAGVGCTGLVIASTGFGAVYAYTIGIQHGIVLATLTIIFAVALELVKPLAIHGAIQALGSWRTWPRAIALSLLGLVAVAYSLTAELSLTASSKADLVAKRTQEGSTATSDKTKYDQAIDELKLIHPSRTVAEVDADILRTKNLRAIAKLKGEKARTERREKLQAVVNSYRPGVQREADPGSTSIAMYLASFGIAVSVTTLAQWLNLVPVLALELGSALAMVLVAAVSPTVREPLPMTLEPIHIPETRPERLLPNHSAEREAVAQSLLVHLENHGGTVAGNERSLALKLGTNKSTLRRTTQGLAAAGLVVVDATKDGTQLSLTRR